MNNTREIVFHVKKRQLAFTDINKLICPPRVSERELFFCLQRTLKIESAGYWTFIIMLQPSDFRWQVSKRLFLQRHKSTNGLIFSQPIENQAFVYQEYLENLSNRLNHLNVELHVMLMRFLRVLYMRLRQKAMTSKVLMNFTSKIWHSTSRSDY